MFNFFKTNKDYEAELNVKPGFSDYETEGGWVLHKYGKMSEHTVITKICKVCNHQYGITKEKNVITKNINIHDKVVPYSSNYDIDVADKCIKYITVCPNCDHHEELFCTPTGEQIKKISVKYLD